MIEFQSFPKGQVLLLWLIISLFDVPARTDEQALGRWAVLASPDVRESGVSDLLMAQLTAAKLSLVEREQLDVVIREIELSKLFNAAAAAQRLQVGQLAKADALILMSLIERDGKKSVRMIVCECRYGSRLKLEQFELDKARLDQIVSDIAGEVEKTRVKFARGVQRIVAVSPFLSKSLSHEFDHLQFGFAGLLGQAISEQPGTAVLEIEEARAIGLELERTGGTVKDRVVPTFIEAEFIVPELARAIEPSKVTLDVSVKASGGQSGTWKRQKLKISEAVAWLTSEVATGVLKSAVNRTTLSRDQQRLALLKRADNFTRLGAYPESIALRESALLLHDPFDERLRLLADYFRGVSLRQTNDLKDSLKTTVRDANGVSRGQTKENLRFWQDREAAMFEHNRRVLQLIEGMLANREVNLVEGSLLWNKGLHQPTHQRPSGEWTPKYHDLKQKFFWDNIPRLQQLNPKLRRGEPLDEVRGLTSATRNFWGSSPASESKIWSATAGNMVRTIERPPFARPEKMEFTGGLRHIERLVTELHHPRWPIPALVAAAMPDRMGVTQTGFRSNENFTYVTNLKLDPGELNAHYERLIASKQPWAEFYGRCGLWGESIRYKSGSKEQINAEFDSLQKFLTSWRKKYPDSEDLVADIDKILTTVRDVNEKGWKDYIAPKKRPHDSDALKLNELPVVRFERIDGTHAEYEVITNCGKSLDAVWNGDQLWLMPVGGALTPIFERPNRNQPGARDFLLDVAWDGRWLWTVTAESGLRVFDLNGKQLGELLSASAKESRPVDLDLAATDGSRLPPFNSNSSPLHRELHPGLTTRTRPPLLISPLGDGRCLVAANYGPLKRLWIAVVTLAPTGSWDVKILLQGTKVDQAGDKNQFQNVDVAAQANWLTMFQRPELNPRPMAILGRSAVSNGSIEVPPLIIDATSLKVSVLPGNFREVRGNNVPPVVANGRLVQNGMIVFESLTPDLLNEKARWTNQVFSASPNRDNTILMQGRFVVHGDELLTTDPAGWARLNTRDWKLDMLAPRPLPNDSRFHYHGVSGHFGLVSWNRNGPLHRVVINERAK